MENDTKKVLIVDDQPSVIKRVDAMLPENYELDGAEDAETGLEMTRKTCYDILLLDYEMPGMNGAWFMENVELSPQVKSQPHPRHPGIHGWRAFLRSFGRPGPA